MNYTLLSIRPMTTSDEEVILSICQDVYGGNDYVAQEWKTYITNTNSIFLGVEYHDPDTGQPRIIAYRQMLIIDSATTIWFRALRVERSMRKKGVATWFTKECVQFLHTNSQTQGIVRLRYTTRDADPSPFFDLCLPEKIEAKQNPVQSTAEEQHLPARGELKSNERTSSIETRTNDEEAASKLATRVGMRRLIVLAILRTLNITGVASLDAVNMGGQTRKVVLLTLNDKIHSACMVNDDLKSHAMSTSAVSSSMTMIWSSIVKSPTMQSCVAMNALGNNWKYYTCHEETFQMFVTQGVVLLMKDAEGNDTISIGAICANSESGQVWSCTVYAKTGMMALRHMALQGQLAKALNITDFECHYMLSARAELVQYIQKEEHDTYTARHKLLHVLTGSELLDYYVSTNATLWEMQVKIDQQ